MWVGFVTDESNASTGLKSWLCLVFTLKQQLVTLKELKVFPFGDSLQTISFARFYLGWNWGFKVLVFIINPTRNLPHVLICADPEPIAVFSFFVHPLAMLQSLHATLPNMILEQASPLVSVSTFLSTFHLPTMGSQPVGLPLSKVSFHTPATESATLIKHGNK